MKIRDGVYEAGNQLYVVAESTLVWTSPPRDYDDNYGMRGTEVCNFYRTPKGNWFKIRIFMLVKRAVGWWKPPVQQPPMAIFGVFPDAQHAYCAMRDWGCPWESAGQVWDPEKELKHA